MKQLFIGILIFVVAQGCGTALNSGPSLEDVAEVTNNPTEADTEGDAEVADIEADTEGDAEVADIEADTEGDAEVADIEADTEAVCHPACGGRECGPDLCGGLCGVCLGLDRCNEDGECECVPNCAGKQCGDDGCGGKCGTCQGGQTCEDWKCKVICGDGLCALGDGESSCSCPQDCGQCNGCCEGAICRAGTGSTYCGIGGAQCQDCSINDLSCAEQACSPLCGDGMCSSEENCAMCPADCGCTACGETCAAGECIFTACNGKDCGDDGCGGSCGGCPAGMVCFEGGCLCLPDCTDKICGDDGCGGSCGACSGNQDQCLDGQCVCQPNCMNKECGDDGCGGFCGEFDGGCQDGLVCQTNAQQETFCVPETMNWIEFPEHGIAVLDTEVTEDQYLLIMGGSLPWDASWVTQPCNMGDTTHPAPTCTELGLERCPVHGVSLAEAQAVCAKVGGRVFKDVAEWKKLAGDPPPIHEVVGTNTTWNTCNGMMVIPTCAPDVLQVRYYPRPRDVPANPDELYDLWGNVAEWTQENKCVGSPHVSCGANDEYSDVGNCATPQMLWLAGVRCVRDL